MPILLMLILLYGILIGFFLSRTGMIDAIYWKIKDSLELNMAEIRKTDVKEPEKQMKAIFPRGTLKKWLAYGETAVFATGHRPRFHWIIWILCVILVYRMGDYFPYNMVFLAPFLMTFIYFAMYGDLSTGLHLDRVNKRGW